MVFVFVIAADVFACSGSPINLSEPVPLMDISYANLLAGPSLTPILTTFGLTLQLVLLRIDPQTNRLQIRTSRLTLLTLKLTPLPSIQTITTRHFDLFSISGFALTPVF